MIPQRVASRGSNLLEAIGVVHGAQGLEVGAEGRGQAVVHLIAAGPQRVPARGRLRVHLECGVVAGDILEGDVRMLCTYPVSHPSAVPNRE